MGILSDHDPVETQEWVESLRAVVHHQGSERATFLLAKLREEANQREQFVVLHQFGVGAEDHIFLHTIDAAQVTLIGQ